MKGRAKTFVLAGLLVAVALAGCAGEGGLKDADVHAPGAHAGLVSSDDVLTLAVLVVDAEYFPIEGAQVFLNPFRLSATTDVTGFVSFSPLEPGDYDLTASRSGYTEGALRVSLSGQGVHEVPLLLEPTATDVPFHVTHNSVAFIQCGFGHNAGAGNVPFPCTILPLNHMLGFDVSGDQDYFAVEIPYAGLANVLHEADWRPQQLGHDILLGFVAHGQGVLPLTDVTDIYGVWNGGPPMQVWITPGEQHQRGNRDFPSNQSDKFDVLVRANHNNATVPYTGVMLNLRIDNWVTFFYNRPGRTDFSALPDV